MKRWYEIEVTFAVEAEQDCDAESKLVYALQHAPLVSPANGIEWSDVGDARQVDNIERNAR